jgi:hypothetical protein
MCQQSIGPGPYMCQPIKRLSHHIHYSDPVIVVQLITNTITLSLSTFHRSKSKINNKISRTFITESSSPNPNPSIFQDHRKSKPNSFELITDFSVIKQVHPNSTQTSINSKETNTNSSLLRTQISFQRTQKASNTKRKGYKSQKDERKEDEG